MTDYKLTQNQIDRLREIDWEEDWEKTLKMIHSFGNTSLPVGDLPWFMEKFIPQEQIRLNKLKAEQKKSVTSEYSKVDIPEIGKKYHLSWAYRGCVWELKALLPEGKCILETPKSKKTRIENIANLLNLIEK